MGIAPRVTRLRAGHPVHLGQAVVIPVEQTLVEGHCGRGALGIFARKYPVYLVICTTRGKHAVNAAGRDQPLEPLLTEVDGLTAALDTVNKLFSG